MIIAFFIIILCLAFLPIAYYCGHQNGFDDGIDEAMKQIKQMYDDYDFDSKNAPEPTVKNILIRLKQLNM